MYLHLQTAEKEPTETDKINQLTNSYVPKKDVPEEKEP